ncbi:MAG: polysaccharide deacetylase family protein, partial [Chloroflexota bacterium]|nr:polysaccharide deacetylase family protein [Chloroflexota bacterium]
MIEATHRNPSTLLRAMAPLLGTIAILAGCAVASPGGSEAPTPAGQNDVLHVIAASPTDLPTAPAATPVPLSTVNATPPIAASTPLAVSTQRPPPPVGASNGSTLLIDRGASGRMEVALTFDAGAERGYAAEILDVLVQYDVKASFGITGHWAKSHPDLVRRIVAEGHMVFNHTWSHSSFTGFSPGTAPLTT